MNGAVFLTCGLLQPGTGSAQNVCEYCGASDPEWLQFAVESGTIVQEKANRCCLKCRDNIANTSDDALVEPGDPTDGWKELAASALGVVQGACVAPGAVAVHMFRTGAITKSVLKYALAASGLAFCAAFAFDGGLMIFDLKDAYAKQQNGKMSKPEFLDHILKALSKWVIGSFGAALLGGLFGILGPITAPLASAGVKVGLTLGLSVFGGFFGRWFGRKLADPVGSMIARLSYVETVPSDALKAGDHILFHGCHSLVVEVQETGQEISVYEETKGPNKRLVKKQIAMVGDSVAKVNYGKIGGLGSGALCEAEKWVSPNGCRWERYGRTFDSFFDFVHDCRKFEDKHPEDRDQQA